MLINEENPPDYVVAALVDDGNFAVAGTARWHLSHRTAMKPKVVDEATSSHEPPSNNSGPVVVDDDDEFEVGTW